MKRYTLLLSFLLLCVLCTKAQTAKKFTINLTDGGKSNVVCFLPEQPSGKAVVCVPGGGYSMLANSHEGTMWSDWFNQKGISYFVVNYRLPNGDRTLPISDVENTIRIVRDSAKVWNINPHDVGIMGFSAGGHLSSVISTQSEFDVRPDFTILFYPVISMDERISHKWSCINFLGEEGHKNPELVRQYSTQNSVRRHLTPPAVIIMANDDRLVPPVTNGIQYYSAMRNQGNECSMFIYPTGDHGFGINTSFKYHDQMLNDLGNWLDNRQTPKPNAIRVACVGNSITDGHGIDVATQHGYPALLQNNLGDGYWVKNFGLSGRTMLNNGDIPYMKELAWRDALTFKPDVVVIKLGTNDSKPQNWKYKEEFKRDLQQMLTALRPDLAQPVTKKKGKKSAPAPNTNPKIYLCTPIHALKTSWDINDQIISNEIIPIQKEVAQEYGLEIIDLNTLFGSDPANYLDDGIHPNENGVKKMADLIYQAIK
ncbi:MAG: alpha/beta hydrolase fold domain-containing protein [Bacteroidales bacterium]|nr:alpha/beta hydrolase fold domain-containing protein [Bacteroidales bacterium]